MSKAYRILLTLLTHIRVGNDEWRFFSRNPKGRGYFFHQPRYRSLIYIQ